MDFPVRVYYEDTDAGGVVYHARYLHFFERARTEYLRKLGFSQSMLMQAWDIAFVVKTISIDFLSPARLDDALQVKTTIAEIRRASLVFTQHLVLGEKVLCQANISVACVALSQMKPTAIPASIQQAFIQSQPLFKDKNEH